jgi:hypothetical protein
MNSYWYALYCALLADKGNISDVVEWFDKVCDGDDISVSMDRRDNDKVITILHTSYGVLMFSRELKISY